MQRDARSGSRGGVGRTAVGARGHGGGVEVGGGVAPRRGVCAVLGGHLSECEEGGGGGRGRSVVIQAHNKHLLLTFTSRCIMALQEWKLKSIQTGASTMKVHRPDVFFSKSTTACAPRQRRAGCAKHGEADLIFIAQSVRLPLAQPAEKKLKILSNR